MKDTALIRVIILNDHLPQKQGLRPMIYGISSSFAALNDHLPQKQGLRRRIEVACIYFL